VKDEDEDEDEDERAALFGEGGSQEHGRAAGNGCA
jgi:hypothetical protein